MNGQLQGKWGQRGTWAGSEGDMSPGGCLARALNLLAAAKEGKGQLFLHRAHLGWSWSLGIAARGDRCGLAWGFLSGCRAQFVGESAPAGVERMVPGQPLGECGHVWLPFQHQ